MLCPSRLTHTQMGADVGCNSTCILKHNNTNIFKVIIFFGHYWLIYAFTCPYLQVLTFTGQYEGEDK